MPFFYQFLCKLFYDSFFNSFMDVLHNFVFQITFNFIQIKIAANFLNFSRFCFLIINEANYTIGTEF